VDRDGCHILPPDEIEQSAEVSVDRVHSARPDQSQEVQRAAVRLYMSARTHQGGIGVEASIGYGRRDAYKILHHDAASAKI
jgi:hypothetical protein